MTDLLITLFVFVPLFVLLFNLKKIQNYLNKKHFLKTCFKETNRDTCYRVYCPLVKDCYHSLPNRLQRQSDDMSAVCDDIDYIKENAVFIDDD